MLPSSKELNYFNQVALDLNISSAAKKLNTSQPSISMAIKRLEDKLNVFLFHRSKSGLVLTTHGQELFSQVKVIISQWHQIKQSIHAKKKEIVGEVNIACHEILSPHMVMLFDILNTKYPRLVVNLQHQATEQTIADVLNGVVDIGFALNLSDHPNLITHTTSTSEIAFWIKKSHNHTCNFNKQNVTLIYDNNNIVCSQLAKRAQAKGLVVDRLLHINNYDIIAKLTKTGAGIGILPGCFVERIGGDGLIRINQLPYSKTQMNAIMRKSDKEVEAIHAVMTEIAALSVKPLILDNASN